MIWSPTDNRNPSVLVVGLSVAPLLNGQEPFPAEPVGLFHEQFPLKIVKVDAEDVVAALRLPTIDLPVQFLDQVLSYSQLQLKFQPSVAFSVASVTFRLMI